MIPMSGQSVGCSRGERLRHGGRCARMLHSTLAGILADINGLHTQWLLLQHQENSIDQFEVFRQIVQLGLSAKILQPDPGAQLT